MGVPGSKRMVRQREPSAHNSEALPCRLLPSRFPSNRSRNASEGNAVVDLAEMLRRPEGKRWSSSGVCHPRGASCVPLRPSPTRPAGPL